MTEVSSTSLTQQAHRQLLHWSKVIKDSSLHTHLSRIAWNPGLNQSSQLRLQITYE